MLKSCGIYSKDSTAIEFKCFSALPTVLDFAMAIVIQCLSRTAHTMDTHIPINYVA